MAPFLEKFFPSIYHNQMGDTSTNQYCNFLFCIHNDQEICPAKVYDVRWPNFLGGAIINGTEVHISMLIIGRVLLGIGVGFANQSVPLYLSEMSPYNYRGTFNVFFQLMITIGILVANLFNYFFAKIEGGWGWRLSLGLARAPAMPLSSSSSFDHFSSRTPVADLGLKFI
ncbi:Sugar transport protein 1 [Forsythia ovata]|uniref:Sugar transport protein 1 n=1 Tax=Forsythia ovata TaxID=205694 RepID=A0ABD1S402_9LAMI